MSNARESLQNGYTQERDVCLSVNTSKMALIKLLLALFKIVLQYDAMFVHWYIESFYVMLTDSWQVFEIHV